MSARPRRLPGSCSRGVILLAGLYLALSGPIVGFTGPLQTHNLVVDSGRPKRRPVTGHRSPVTGHRSSSQ
ncbi:MULTISPECIES: SPW repeat protein [Pseudonocardia]|nr:MULTISPECIES: SPW repeat protein [Pseudonocardia]